MKIPLIETNIIFKYKYVLCFIFKKYYKSDNHQIEQKCSFVK